MASISSGVSCRNHTTKKYDSRWASYFSGNDSVIAECTFPLTKNIISRIIIAIIGILFIATISMFQSALANDEYDAAIHCLALNIYFEARGEPTLGKYAVGHVVMNRVYDESFPNNACRVVQQGGEHNRHRCQFSWWCDGRSDSPREQGPWEESILIAEEVYWGSVTDPTYGALWYHAKHIKPTWHGHLRPTSIIGRHIFYHRQAKSAISQLMIQ